MAMAHRVFCLQNTNHFHVGFGLVVFQDAKPMFNGLTVLGLD